MFSRKKSKLMNLVSIITPVYNSEKFLEQCIQSVISQTYKNWEHILVDDCSTDNSKAIVDKFLQSDTRVKYIKLKTNSGAGIARNRLHGGKQPSFYLYGL